MEINDLNELVFNLASDRIRYFMEQNTTISRYNKQIYSIIEGIDPNDIDIGVLFLDEYNIFDAPLYTKLECEEHAVYSYFIEIVIASNGGLIIKVGMNSEYDDEFDVRKLTCHPDACTVGDIYEDLVKLYNELSIFLD